MIVPDKKNINDRHWLPELSKALEHEVVQFSALHDRMRATLAEHGIQASLGGPPDAVLAALSGLTREARQELHLQARQWLDSEKKLHKTHGEFMMTQGAHERQWMGNRWQFVPRTLRSPAASLLGLVGKSGAARVLPPTLQVVASLMLTAAQHVAAGFDERAKQEYNNVLNLLYGQFFTASGADKLARGQPLDADDIDTAKLRGFISMPMQSLVKRVSAEVERQVTTLRGLLADRPPAAGQGETDSRASDQAALAGMENDATLLREGRLSELDPDGLAQSLLLASEKSVLSEQLWRDLVAKYTVKEFSAQTAQRLGQAFHLGVFGSAASSIIGKVTSAASGGTRQAPVAQTVGVSVLSGVMAAIGASNQHTAISVKNNRREGEVDVGLGKQVLRGVMGGLSESLAQRRGSRAGQDMKALLAQDQIGNLLGFVKLLNQQLSAEFDVAPETLSLSEAGRVLGPGHASAAGATEIVIEMDQDQATSGTPPDCVVSSARQRQVGPPRLRRYRFHQLLVRRTVAGHHARRGHRLRLAEPVAGVLHQQQLRRQRESLVALREAGIVAHAARDALRMDHERLPQVEGHRGKQLQRERQGHRNAAHARLLGRHLRKLRREALELLRQLLLRGAQQLPDLVAPRFLLLAERPQVPFQQVLHELFDLVVRQMAGQQADAAALLPEVQHVHAGGDEGRHDQGIHSVGCPGK